MVLKEVDESGNTKGEDMEEAIINFLLLAALVLLPLADLEVLDADDTGTEVFLLDPVPPVGLPVFCHNKALNGLPACALAPFLITPP